MKGLLGVIVLAILSLAMTPPQAGLSLISESLTTTWYDQQYGITCYHEDSNHQRLWNGNLAAGASFSVPLKMCPSLIEGVPFLVGPGGASILMWSHAKEGLDLTATSPSGRVYVARSSMVGRPGRELLSRCVLSDTNTSTLEPGVYNVELRNVTGRTVRDIELTVNVQLGWYVWQQASCAPEDWNFD